MHISSEKILDKMLHEITHAKQNANDQPALEKQLTKIKLLCELLLDEIETTAEQQAEIKKMFENKTENDATIEEDDGMSIFDF